MKRGLSPVGAFQPPRKRQELVRADDYELLKQQEEQVRKLQSSIRHQLQRYAPGEDLMDTILHYAMASCVELCNAVKRLPRELRDMVYADVAQVQGHANPTAGQCSHRFLNNAVMFDCKHFLDPDFVGKDTAVEITEAFYKANTFVLLTCFHLQPFLDDESLNGVITKDFIRGIKVEIPNRALVSKDHHGDVDSCEGHDAELLAHTVKALQDCLRELLRVKYQKGFQLELVLSDRAGRLDFDDERIKSIMMAVVPVYKELKEKGFEVRVTLRNAYSLDHLNDLTAWLDCDPENWDDILEDYREAYRASLEYSDSDDDDSLIMGFPSADMFELADFMDSDEAEMLAAMEDSEDDDDDDLPGLE